MTGLARSSHPHENRSDELAAFAADVVDGLTASPKHLPPKYFYDAVGSELFEQITRLSEYYPTRTEMEILKGHASRLSQLIPAEAGIVEFGSGSTAKARILINAAKRPAAYVPVDISAEFVAGEAARLKADQPQLLVLPVVADFMRPFALPPLLGLRPLVGFFPGSTIGNFEPHQAAAFLRQAAGILGPDATFIVGVDLAKDTRVLFEAYNDAQGVTARFNRNLLVRINRELGANFDPNEFEHRAFYNRKLRRIEMHLASSKAQKVRVLGRSIDFRAGETIHTESSYKYTVTSFRRLAAGAGWRSREVLTDPNKYFSVHVLRPGKGL